MPGRSSKANAKAKANAKDAPGVPRKGRIAVVWGEFNPTVTEEMRDRAARVIHAAGYEAAPIVAVNGSYDLPFAVDRALRVRGVVAAVAIGCIITGETKHDEVIAHAAAKSLLDVSIKHGKPVGLGITGPGQTYPQAKDRIDRADAAVEAVLKLLAIRSGRQ